MDITQVCRSCMKELETWEFEYLDPRSREMFYFCTNIRIADEDKLPKHMCHHCLTKLETAYSFVIDSQKVDATLRNIACRSETSIIIEPESYNKNSTEELLTDNVLFTYEPNYHEQMVIDSENNHYYELNEVGNSQGNVNIEDVNEINDQIPNESNNIINNDSHSKENGKLVCPECNKEFRSKTWFDKHTHKEHKQKELLQFTCDQCQKSFAKEWRLKHHMMTHSDERKFECTTCGKKFKLKKQLVDHARAHSDSKPFACDKCGNRFKKRSILKCHMKVHDEQKWHLCNDCGRRFAQASNLAAHLKRHRNERPWACAAPACQYRAGARDALARHELRHRRQGDRPLRHKCPHCAKAFFDASSLQRHRRTHTGERPYRCPQCARSFGDSWKRKSHLMRAHGYKLADIPRLTRDGEQAP